MATLRKPTKTQVLIWSVVFLAGAPVYVSIREAIRPLESSQLGTLAVSFVVGLAPITLFAWIFKGATTSIHILLTFVCYLAGVWGAFHVAAVFDNDPQWGWAYGPQSWVYVATQYVKVVDEFQGENLLPATEAFFKIASGLPAEGNTWIAPHASERPKP